MAGKKREVLCNFVEYQVVRLGMILNQSKR